MIRDAFDELARTLAARDMLAGRRGTFGAAERVIAGVAGVGFKVAPEPVRAAPPAAPAPVPPPATAPSEDAQVASTTDTDRPE